jgi:hypothetical protein
MVPLRGALYQKWPGKRNPIRRNANAVPAAVPGPPSGTNHLLLKRARIFSRKDAKRAKNDDIITDSQPGSSSSRIKFFSNGKNINREGAKNAMDIRTK